MWQHDPGSDHAPIACEEIKTLRLGWSLVMAAAAGLLLDGNHSSDRHVLSEIRDLVKAITCLAEGSGKNGLAS